MSTKGIKMLDVLLEKNGGKLALEKGNIHFYGEHISGTISRIERKNSEYYALVETPDGYLFSEIIPKEHITENFIFNVERSIKSEKK